MSLIVEYVKNNDFDNVKKYLEQKNFKVVIYNTISEVRRALEIHVPTVTLLDWKENWQVEH